MGISYRPDDDLAFLQYSREDDIRNLAAYLMFDKDGEKRTASEIGSEPLFTKLQGQSDQWRRCWQPGKRNQGYGPSLAGIRRSQAQPCSFVYRQHPGAGTEQQRTSNKHYELVVNFAHMMLEIMPLGIHTEYLLTARVGKPMLAQLVLEDCAERYQGAMQQYKAFLNAQHRELVRGNIGDKTAVLQRIKDKAKQLIHSQENQLLLTLPYGRMAAFQAA